MSSLIDMSSLFKSIKTIVLVGASDNTTRASNIVMKYLLSNGFNVYIVYIYYILVF